MEWLLPIGILAVVVLTAACVLWMVLRAQDRSRSSDQALSLLQNQVAADSQQNAQLIESLRRGLTESVENLSTQVSRSLGDTHRTVGERLDQASRVIGDVRQKLGHAEESSKRLMALGADIASLQDLLRPPKLRGLLGELFLGDLLAQILPAAHFELQHTFRGGQVVDAVLRLHGGMVPVDAKFPLDNFRRIFEAESEDGRKAARKSFVRDVKGHIDAIASKYIRVDEGTFDFALMYVPAENVYYETIIRSDESDGGMILLNYALKKRVIPVSPNTFYGYLQTVLLGLKGLRVEERAREILGGLARLEKELAAFDEAFRLVGQHMDNSHRKYQESQRRLERIQNRLGHMDDLARGDSGTDSGTP